MAASGYKRVSIIGSTGSIGCNALDVAAAFPDQFEIIGLSAGRNLDLLQTQILKWKPQIVSVALEEDANTLRDWAKTNHPTCTIVFGTDGMNQVATEGNLDLLVVAVVGTAGVLPTYHAITHSIPVALACKEVLVAAGPLIMAAAQEYQVPVLPIDSEHAALKQCLAGINEDHKQISKLVLTASGGPFWKRPTQDFPTITKAEALKHPNWDMGAKITIDSATMMNKGLEVIEAHYLFSLPATMIDVVIHPKSIIHSLVEFTDGTWLAQMGTADMRFPIQYALSYPQKWANPWPKLSLTQVGALEFFEPDFTKFPLLKLAYHALESGGAAPIILNAANEAAVTLFLNDQISFNDIPKLVANAMETLTFTTPKDIDTIVGIDLSVKESLTTSRNRL
jgi:1-deoxy-D-xylulose-5-phosphate reductoisomerase